MSLIHRMAWRAVTQATAAACNNVIHFQNKPTKRYCIISEHSGFPKANDQMCFAAIMPVSKRGLRIGLQEILVAQTQNYSTSQCQDYVSETVSALILLQTISKTTWQNNGRISFQHQCIRSVSSSESNFMQQYNTWGSGNHPEWLERWLKTWTRPRRRAQSSLQNHELIAPSKPFGTKQCLPMWQSLLDATSSRMVIKLRASSVFYVEGLPVVVLWLTVVLDWLTHECRQSGQQMKFHTTGCITLTFNANILYTSLYNLELLRRMFWTISVSYTHLTLPTILLV